jgi:hypothetical protein
LEELRMMKRITATLVGGTALAASAPVLAQNGPGWNIVWGAQAVPLGPWTTAFIAVALAAAAFVFLRKGARGGAMSVLIAAVIGGIYVAEDVNAVLSPDFIISEPSGSAFVACPVIGLTAEEQDFEIPQIIVDTTISRGVRLTALEPVFSATRESAIGQQSAGISNAIPMCEVGTVLTPGSLCWLPCLLPEPI